MIINSLFEIIMNIS